MYTKKVLNHFKKPHNYGKIKNPDGLGKAGNIICGDTMWLYIKVGKDKKGREIIKDIKFETFGCVAAISTSSVITDLAKGKTLADAAGINKGEVVKSLGGLPPVKLHCSVLAVDALSEAIYDYLSKNKKAISEELQKKHQRIEQEEKIIREKYKDWIGAEEKMHQND
ncbi:MAG: nitrogen fixation protein NifU [Parcubacteria group bacterium Athens1014_10]|nr:MAG: nitrogen fixation protein NifU [Parcubacteria group bacterium Athens1014_10]TSD04978.1 MAG: nitrogen fixation protein NifU [Parcubacteria group bacterium Athens0714_12]